jgi:uncharacterized protein (DUF362 family)
MNMMRFFPRWARQLGQQNPDSDGFAKERPAEVPQELLLKEVLDRPWTEVFDDLLREGQNAGFFFGQLPKHIVIKPNLCYVAAPETGITTDVKLVEHLLIFLKGLYPSVDISIIESDSTDRNAEEAFERLGYRELSKKYNINLVNLSIYDHYTTVLNKIPFPIHIPTMFLDDIFFISIANLKTHTYQQVTLTYKNLFGCLPNSSKEHFHEYLNEVLYYLANHLFVPDLCIIDGRIGLQGQGPVDGFPIKSNILILGNDPTAVDTVCSHIMGFNPCSVPYLRYAYKRNGFRGYSKYTENISPIKFAFIEKWRYKVIRWKIFVTRTCNILNARLKRLVYIFFRLPSYTREHSPHFRRCREKV